MKLSETSFAQKLAKAPKVSVASRVATISDLLKDRQDQFATKIVGLVDEIAAISAARSVQDCSALVAKASEIAGVAGLIELPETARIASWLAQLGDEMPIDSFDWDALDVFCRTLQLVTRPGRQIAPAEMRMLLSQLETVRATIKARGEERDGHQTEP
jgi:hypothetical protein